MIKAMVFDFAGVLVRPANYNVFNNLVSKKSGKSFDHVHKIWHKYWLRWRVHKLSMNDLLKGYSCDLGLKSSKWIKPYLWNYFKLNKSVLDDVKRLKKNYKVYILSNQVREHFEHVSKKYKFKDVFDGIFISYILNCAKPDTLIFSKFLQKTKLKPGECVFIDNQLNNVKAAMKLGFKTIHYRTYNDFKKQLKCILNR
ncbi:HAD family phosphatase [Candidatus Woesearchaeota archaeon]|nr:HAD family phosphatase [Candidatus Woesearchaeota archaeon]MBW3021949.1 HAD family phosphatase [Candidatus Woesearchaeota archaeon]